MAGGKKQHRVRMRKRWERNPHCYWCGIKTVWSSDDGNANRRPDAATIDHIRSRFCDERQQQDDGTWTQGLWVLSCSKCNQERASLEMAWLLNHKPEVFYAKGNARPANPQLQKVQCALATSILSLLKNGGTVDGKDTHVKNVMKLARRLDRLYEDERRKRHAERDSNGQTKQMQTMQANPQHTMLAAVRSQETIATGTAQCIEVGSCQPSPCNCGSKIES